MLESVILKHESPLERLHSKESKGFVEDENYCKAACAVQVRRVPLISLDPPEVFEAEMVYKQFKRDYLCNKVCLKNYSLLFHS